MQEFIFFDMIPIKWQDKKYKNVNTVTQDHIIFS